MITGILIAAALVGGTGLVIGLLLGVAGKKFAVEVNEKEIAVREQLPGNNCGGCGYPGCDGLAAAIAAGKAPVNGCPVGGNEVAKAIAAIMGEEITEGRRMTAFVKCAGDCESARNNYVYDGVEDCAVMAFIPGGGEKKCHHGCLGYGTCVKACNFNAIRVINGIAHIDKEKCKACGQCVAVCPHHLIELIPYEQTVKVSCSSQDKGKATMNACDKGCIGCKKCEKNCPVQAITVTDNVAHIDYEKCTNCGLCNLIFTDCYAAKLLPQSSSHSKSADLFRKSLLSHVWWFPRQKAFSCKHEKRFALETWYLQIKN